MKVLNLFADIGGNRKLWKDVEVTAVETEELQQKRLKELTDSIKELITTLRSVR